MSVTGLSSPVQELFGFPPIHSSWYVPGPPMMGLLGGGLLPYPVGPEGGVVDGAPPVLPPVAPLGAGAGPVGAPGVPLGAGGSLGGGGGPPVANVGLELDFGRLGLGGTKTGGFLGSPEVFEPVNCLDVIWIFALIQEIFELVKYRWIHWIIFLGLILWIGLIL